MLDETHTLCAGPGGCDRRRGLAPDVLVVGKAIGGGVPIGAFGMTAELADRIPASVELEDVDVGGIGGTLAGNALSLAATRATLTEVLTDEAFARMTRSAGGGRRACRRARRAGLPWHVTRLGCRAEYRFSPSRRATAPRRRPPTTSRCSSYLHLHALNRGVLLTPFHNMALMCPATTAADVDRAHRGVRRRGGRPRRLTPAPLAAAGCPPRARSAAPASRRPAAQPPVSGR